MNRIRVLRAEGPARIVAFPRTLRSDGARCLMQVRAIPRGWPAASPYDRIAALQEVAGGRWRAIDGDGKLLVELTDAGAKKARLLGTDGWWEFGPAVFHKLRDVVDPSSDLCILDVRLDVGGRRPEVTVRVVA